MKKPNRVKACLSLALILFLISLTPAAPAGAQDNPPSGPVYIIQEGDTLWDIAQRFGVTMDELQNANGITDPGKLSAGQQLIIPGLEGIQGTLTTQKISYGETLFSLSRRYQVPVNTLARLNHLTSPSELYAGASLVVPENTTTNQAGRRIILSQGQSLLELAVASGSDPWKLAQSNLLTATWNILPGEVLRLPGSQEDGPGALPGQIEKVKVSPLPLVQGKTTVIQVSAQSGITLTGSITGHDLHFFPDQDGKSYVAMQGIYAMQEPGLYPMTLKGVLSDGTAFGFSQMVYVVDGNYPVKQEPIPVDQAGLDPTVTKPEDAEWMALAQPATPQKMWDGKIKFPMPALFYDQYSSIFGVRRRYNDDPQVFFHTGLDMPSPVGTEVSVIAPGTVVFAGHLEVRGNAVMVDHGWGVYSSYMHLSEVKVQAGQHVDMGQVVGLVGNTGLRTTGSHLHWEMLVGDVQVDPVDWLEQVYP
ncbi:MAG: LysM peptidoglycan-binding domain-containing protein [Omnitrophica WOR_2 bacterium]